MLEEGLSSVQNEVWEGQMLAILKNYVWSLVRLDVPSGLDWINGRNRGMVWRVIYMTSIVYFPLSQNPVFEATRSTSTHFCLCVLCRLPPSYAQSTTTWSKQLSVNDGEVELCPESSRSDLES